MFPNFPLIFAVQPTRNGVDHSKRQKQNANGGKSSSGAKTDVDLRIVLPPTH